MQQTAWRVIRGLPRRCRGDHTGLRGLSQSGFCCRAPQLIRMLYVFRQTICQVAPQGALRERFAARRVWLRSVEGLSVHVPPLQAGHLAQPESTTVRSNLRRLT